MLAPQSITRRFTPRSGRGPSCSPPWRKGTRGCVRSFFAFFGQNEPLSLIRAHPYKAERPAGEWRHGPWLGEPGAGATERFLICVAAFDRPLWHQHRQHLQHRNTVTVSIIGIMRRQRCQRDADDASDAHQPDAWCWWPTCIRLVSSVSIIISIVSIGCVWAVPCVAEGAGRRVSDVRTVDMLPRRPVLRGCPIKLKRATTRPVCHACGCRHGSPSRT